MEIFSILLRGSLKIPNHLQQFFPIFRDFLIIKTMNLAQIVQRFG
nr:hypothetical protein [Alysiella crassa]